MWAKFALSASAILLFLILLAVLPLPIPAYLDFQVLYQANMGLLHGISPYDHAGQVDMIAQLANVPPEQVYVLPFPYPPWYALQHGLAGVAADRGGRAGVVGDQYRAAACHRLADHGGMDSDEDGCFPLYSPCSFCRCSGSLFVGQYDFPVLLGAALMIYALPAREAGPHGGCRGAANVQAAPWQADPAGRRWLISGCGETHSADGRSSTFWLQASFLFGVGFLADRGWPLDYFHSLTRVSEGFPAYQLRAVQRACRPSLASRLGGDARFAPGAPDRSVPLCCVKRFMGRDAQRNLWRSCAR